MWWSYDPFSAARVQMPGLSEVTVSRYVARRRVELGLERREVSIPQTYMWVFGVRPAPDRFVHQGKLVQLNTFDDKGGQFGPLRPNCPPLSTEELTEPVGSA